MYTAILCSEVLDNIKMHNIHRAVHKIGVSYMSGICYMSGKDVYCNFLLFFVKCKIVMKTASLTGNSKSICSKDLFLLISDLWVTQ